jgi:hypothetical protein
MRVSPCPFCGVATEVPHETQALCIAALHGEIARTRALIERVKQPLLDVSRRGDLSNADCDLRTEEPHLRNPI